MYVCMYVRSALDAEMKDASRAGVALQNKKAKHKESNLYLFCSVGFGYFVIAFWD